MPPAFVRRGTCGCRGGFLVCRQRFLAHPSRWAYHRRMAREPRGVREYSTDEIVVEWQPRLCFHSHNCIRALPKVFDPERRPWGDATHKTNGFTG
jgi:uncharacterized Fe-S cluster protein YjdI